MNHRHIFMPFIITLMFVIPMVVQAAPPPWAAANNNSLNTRVSDLEALIVAQQDIIDNLTAKLACVSAASDSTEFIFDGCNVNVRNGAGQTDSVNGLGNLIVGYNEDGGTTKDRTGSHNLVVDTERSYRTVREIQGHEYFGHTITLTFH